MTTITIRNAAALYPCRSRGEAPIIGAWLRIDGSGIVDLGPEPCPAPFVRADRVIDARGKVLLPGFINLHHHFFQSVTRALPAGLYANSLDWLRTMYPLWQELDAEVIDAASRLAAAELLLTGATTSVDFAYLYPGGRGELFDIEVAAVRDSGLRLHAIRGCTPRLDGSLGRDLAAIPGANRIALEESADAILAACEAAIARHHDRSPHAMCRVGVGPTALPAGDADLLRRLSQLALEAGCDRHIHLQPRPVELEECARLHGCRPTEFLRRVGWLGERSIIAHATMHTPEDIRLLAESGTGVAHCPSQNMRLGYPAGPIPEMRAAGVRVAVGVDGGASNDSGSYLGELRLAHMIHRLEGVHPGYGPAQWMRAPDVLWMATRDAAAILGREDIGRLDAGCAADAVLIDLRQIAYAGALHDPLSAILFTGDTTIVDTTIVNGEIVVEGGRLCRARESSLIDEANRVAAEMIRRAETRTDRRFESRAGELLRLCRCG
ncbi:MAG: 8-oxoguanine deaminase [Betaproteobacteria bacterium]|nr:8-oxoguanine deaminase [Betaproteobacteria bacterium]